MRFELKELILYRLRVFRHNVASLLVFLALAFVAMCVLGLVMRLAGGWITVVIIGGALVVLLFQE